MEKLESLFLAHEVEAIKNTPIREHENGDEVRWRYENKGQFSVKSAYLLETGYYDEHPNMSGGDRKSWSKMVWSLSLPPKVRIFAWRAFSNLIPTAGNLKLHHVPTDGICSFCKDRWGSTEHSLLFCPRVRKIWKNSRFWNAMRKARFLEMADVGKAVKNECGDGDYELWVLMLWKVWLSICKVTHGEMEGLPEEMEIECMAMWEAYQAARPISAREATLGVRLGAKEWCKPKHDRFRVDVDVLFLPEQGKFGVGVIIRDHKGEALVAISKPTGPYSNVMIAEMMAMVHGIMVSMEYDIAPIEIYTDSILVARIMANQEDEGKLLPDDVREILEVARENMLVGVVHIFRTANRAAHCLAQYVRRSSRPNCWTANFPSWIRDVVLDDVS